jgi:hypothetical protein
MIESIREISKVLSNTMCLKQWAGGVGAALLLLMARIIVIKP